MADRYLPGLRGRSGPCQPLHALPRLQVQPPPANAAAKKTIAKKTPGKPKAAQKAAKRAKPAPDDAVIVWRGRKNPFREGTGAHERTERLREHDGQTVVPFIAAGGKRGTVGTCRTRGLVKLAIMKVA
jgi:hypothetical protein